MSRPSVWPPISGISSELEEKLPIVPIRWNTISSTEWWNLIPYIRSVRREYKKIMINNHDLEEEKRGKAWSMIMGGRELVWNCVKSAIINFTRGWWRTQSIRGAVLMKDGRPKSARERLSVTESNVPYFENQEKCAEFFVAFPRTIIMKSWWIKYVTLFYRYTL